MKKIAIAVGAIALIVGAVVVTFRFGAFGLQAYTCGADDQIAQRTRSALDDSAMTFVRTVLGPNPDSAYTMMTQEAQNSTTAKAFGMQLKAIIDLSGPYQDIHVAHTYFIRDFGTAPGTRAICGSLANDGWIAVAVKPGLSQGYVVAFAKTRNNDWAFTLWLLPAGSEWRVHYFHMNVSSIVGRTPEMLLGLARQERDSGHAFNATVLFGGLKSLVYRGSTFQLGIAQPVEKESRELKRPLDLQSDPPFTWNLNGVQYRVAQISVIGIDNRLGLIFILPQTSWTDEKNADRRTGPSSRRSSPRARTTRECSASSWHAHSSRTIRADSEQFTTVKRDSLNVRATFTPDKNHPIGVGSRDGSANLGAGWPMECPLSISALVAGCLTAAGADNEL